MKVQFYLCNCWRKDLGITESGESGEWGGEVGGVIGRGVMLFCERVELKAVLYFLGHKCCCN